MSDTLQQLRTINRWRSSLNPLRGLDIQRAASLLDEGERGAFADLQWTFRKTERRHPTLRGLKRRRLAAIGKLDWNIKEVQSPESSVQSRAAKQAKYLREQYNKIDNLRQAIRALALAEFRGYAHVELQAVSDQQSAVSPARYADTNHFEFIEQWFMCRDGLYGAWQYNADSASGRTQGTDITGVKLLTREVDDPVDEIALLCYVRSGFSDKNWDAFIEIYGIPKPVVIMPTGVPAGKEDDYRASAEKIAGGQSGALPNGSDVKYPSETRGNQPFLERLKRLDEQLVLAGTGGKLTMLSEATGIGGGASDVQADVFQDIAIDEALEISEIFQKQFDKFLLAEKFPGQPVLAYFELSATEETDVSAIVDHAVKLSQAGYKMDEAEMSEKTGYQLTAVSIQPADRTAVADSPVPPLADSSPSIANRLRAAWNAIFNSAAAPVRPLARSPAPSDAALYATAAAKDFAPMTAKYGDLLGRLEAALALEDETVARAEIDALKPELEKMLADKDVFASVLANTNAADLMEKLLGRAAVNAMDEAKQNPAGNRLSQFGRWLFNAFDPDQPRSEDGQWVAYGDRGAVIEHDDWAKRERLADSLDAQKAQRGIKEVAKKYSLKIEGPDWDRVNPYKVLMGKTHQDEVRTAIKAPDQPQPKPVRVTQFWDDDNPKGRPTDQYGRRM